MRRLPLYPRLLIHKSWRQHRMTLRPSRYESFLIMLPFKVTSNLPSRLSIKRTQQSETMCGMRRKVNQFQIKYFPFISTGTFFHFYWILYVEVEESCLSRKNVFPSVFARLCGSSFMITRDWKSTWGMEELQPPPTLSIIHKWLFNWTWII